MKDRSAPHQTDQASQQPGRKGRTWADLTIAVLPFVNMSASAEDEYFSDGITEEIINALANIRHLKVTSRTSSFFFKDKQVPLQRIGRQLGVSTVLEGSVRRSGTMIRITAQLIQVEEDVHFWSETWDRSLEDIFTVQDEISLLIADKVREHGRHFDIQDRLVEKQTDNLSAYEHSLQAKFHSNRWNAEDMQRAITLYEQALALDPDHVESYLGLADSYGFMATTGFMPYEEAWGRAAHLTQQAQLRREQHPGVHYQLANLAFFTASDYRKAFEHNVRALTIKPNYAEAQQFMSFLYVIAGELRLSQKHLNIARAMNPLSPETRFYRAYFHYMTEAYEPALAQLDECLLENPKNIPAHTVKCYCLLKLGRYDEVASYFEQVPSDIVVPQDQVGLTALAYTLQRDEVRARPYVRQLEEQAPHPDGFRADSYRLLLYAATGETDRAFAWMHEAVDNRLSLLLFHFADPLLNTLKDDPRYRELRRTLFPIDLKLVVKEKKKALLDKASVATYQTRLLDYLREERPYLDPSVSLRSLAEQVDLHPNQLSWLINERMGKNFSELINHYRVRAFQQLARDPKKAHVTLIGLAYESGFNSKTVFNTYFKRETGLTPRQFLRQLS